MLHCSISLHKTCNYCMTRHPPPPPYFQTFNVFTKVTWVSDWFRFHRVFQPRSDKWISCNALLTELIAVLTWQNLRAITTNLRTFLLSFGWILLALSGSTWKSLSWSSLLESFSSSAVSTNLLLSSLLFWQLSLWSGEIDLWPSWGGRCGFIPPCTAAPSSGLCGVTSLVRECCCDCPLDVASVLTGSCGWWDLVSTWQTK